LLLHLVHSRIGGTHSWQPSRIIEHPHIPI
jgi:hypothetical protein